jgi:signal peptidase II
MRGKTFWFVLLLPMLVGFDWGTKALVNRSLPEGGEIAVIPGWLSWLHAENPNVAWSIELPMALVFVGGFLAIAGILWTVWHLPRTARLQSAALAVMGAGAIGNLGDRLVDGTVTDFVKVYTEHPTLRPWLVERFGSATWPIFNVADVCLLAGVGLWLVHGWFEREEEAAPTSS